MKFLDKLAGLAACTCLIPHAANAATTQVEVVKAPPTVIANTPLQAIPTIPFSHVAQKTNAVAAGIQTAFGVVSLQIPQDVKAGDFTYSVNCSWTNGMDSAYPVVTIIRAGNFVANYNGDPLKFASTNGVGYSAVANGATFFAVQSGDYVTLNIYREAPSHSGQCFGFISAKLY
ncbi:MAG TPA: hypothetical protein VFK82_08455 [Burkholderiaceae bacterium]|nr:hypothetical protein [Burkholderiaceae bacterium]